MCSERLAVHSRATEYSTSPLYHDMTALHRIRKAMQQPKARDIVIRFRVNLLLRTA